MQVFARFFLLIFLADSYLSTASAAELMHMRWTVGGIERQALVAVPAPSSARERAPVLFVFHGHGGTANSAARTMRIEDLWPQAIVLYMQGLPTPGVKLDPEGKRSGWQHALGDQGDRDLKFFDAVLADLHQKYPVDDSRIYAAGFSNGAFFNFLLWQQRSRQLAGIAACAGVLLPDIHPAEPRAYLQIAGRNDPLVPFENQSATAEMVRKLDRAEAPGWSCGNNCTFYPSKIGTPVMTIFHPGGHMCPRPSAARMVEFFKANPRHG